MDPSRDIIVAYMQNGEMLSPDHGFPVRMIIPGFIGGRMVKWLKRIVVTTQESESYYHYKDNRVLPPHVDAELANAEGTIGIIISIYFRIKVHLLYSSLSFCFSLVVQTRVHHQ